MTVDDWSTFRRSLLDIHGFKSTSKIPAPAACRKDSDSSAAPNSPRQQPNLVPAALQRSSSLNSLQSLCSTTLSSSDDRELTPEYLSDIHNQPLLPNLPEEDADEDWRMFGWLLDASIAEDLPQPSLPLERKHSAPCMYSPLPPLEIEQPRATSFSSPASVKQVDPQVEADGPSSSDRLLAIRPMRPHQPQQHRPWWMDLTDEEMDRQSAKPARKRRARTTSDYYSDEGDEELSGLPDDMRVTRSMMRCAKMKKLSEQNQDGAEKREPEMKIENVFDHNEFDAQHHGAFHDASFGLNDGLVDLDGNILAHGDILYHSEDEDGTESGDSTMCDDFSDFGNYAQPSANDFINQQVEERLRQQKAQAQIEEEIRQRKEEQQAAHEQRMSALNVQQQQLQVQRYGPVSSDVRHSARRTAASRRLKYDDEVQLGVADGAVIYPAIRPNGIAIIPPKIDQKAKPGRPSNKDRQRFVREGLAMCKKMGLDPAKLRPTDYIDLYGKQCHCDTPYNRKKCYIACESCQKWYHTKCVNLTEKKARKLTEWDCQACRGESFPVSTVEGGDQASSAVRKQPQAAAATTTTEEEDSRCQKCGQIESPHGYDFYVACDSCDKWYHAACVGIKKEEAETTSFVCYKCLIEPVRKLKEGYKFPLAEALQVIQKARNAFEECKDQNICKIVRSLDFDVFIDRLHVSTYDQFAAEFKEHFESQHVGITDKSQGYKSAMDSVSQWVVTELYKNHLPQLAKGQQY